MTTSYGLHDNFRIVKYCMHVGADYFTNFVNLLERNFYLEKLRVNIVVVSQL